MVKFSQPASVIRQPGVVTVSDHHWPVMESCAAVARKGIHFPQIPTKDWIDTIGDPVIAEAIVDRLLHNAHKITLKGEQGSYRKKLAQTRKEESK